MSEDSPKIVSLETSLELSEFPSEAELPSETGSPSEAAPLSQAEPPSSHGGAGAASGDRARIGFPAFVSAPPEGVAAASASEKDVPEEPVRVNAHVGPATVTDFPVRPQTQAAVALPSLAPGPVTLVELIERRGGFDWREAVAVIHQICLYLREHSPHAPILLDPRNIQITERGEVQLLSGQSSSDPLVIQVGRLLRTMLMGKEAPPELRLLLSQATFELPIFESIEDVDRALAQLNKLDEPGPAGLALLRAVAAPPPPRNPDDGRGDPAVSDSLDPAHEARIGTPVPLEDDTLGLALRQLRFTRGRDLRGDRVDRRPAADPTGRALPHRRAGNDDGPGGTDRDRGPSPGSPRNRTR